VKSVRLRIVSKSGDQQIEQHFKAELYVKGNQSYYRYHETDENMGRTITTLKVEINVNLSDHLGKISWSYDLFVSDELSGTYYLTAEISEMV
jgi:uncharacterized beta-barrel protein YwiB (DUF1934 family)